MKNFLLVGAAGFLLSTSIVFAAENASSAETHHHHYYHHHHALKYVEGNAHQKPGAQEYTRHPVMGKKYGMERSREPTQQNWHNNHHPHHHAAEANK